MPFWQYRRLLFGLLLLLLMSVAIRIALHNDFPIYLVNDSSEYLSISKDIYEALDFSNSSLGHWRMPGYPVFLSLVRFLSRFDSASLVIAQKSMGLGCILLGLAIAFLLRSRLLAKAMVLFLGLNPVYLLNEHLVMSEGLFLLSLLGLSVAALVCLVGEVTLLKGILLGIASGVCVLIRANGLFFCAPLVVGVILVRSSGELGDQALQAGRIRAGSSQAWIEGNSNGLVVGPGGGLSIGPFGQRSDALPRRIRLGLLRFSLGFLVGTIMLLGPWLWRNYLVFESIVPLTRNSNTNLFISLSQHDLLDTSLPQISRFAKLYDPYQPHTIYAIVWQLRRDVSTGEAQARSLVLEQLANQPRRYLQEVLYALLHFVGYPVPHATYGRTDVHWWFDNMVGDVERVHSTNLAKGWYTADDSAYIASRADSCLTKLWSKAGMLYLMPFRAVLVAVFIFSTITYLVRNSKGFDLTHKAIILFSLSYLFTGLAHSVTLSDYDRFATPFDWVLVMIICLVWASCWGRGVQWPWTGRHRRVGDAS